MNDQPAAKKSLGQHWLNDATSLQAICDAAQVGPGDTVLEIGPGHGSLTTLLTRRAKQVVAVELDDDLAAKLVQLTATNLTIINQNILQFDFAQLPSGYKIVANIPYYLTSNLLRVVSESTNRPRVMALLVQKEVAERIAAPPGQMSLLSVTTQYYWQVKLDMVVVAEVFLPPPKVDSQIVVLSQKTEPIDKTIDTQQFFRLAKAGFSQRRKTLANSLSAGLQLSRDEVQTICSRASIDAKRRAQSLSLNEWTDLYKALHN